MRRNSLVSFCFCSGLASRQARPTASRVASWKSMCGRTFSSASLRAFCLSPAASCLSLFTAASTSSVTFFTSSSGFISCAQTENANSAANTNTHNCISFFSSLNFFIIQYLLTQLCSSAFFLNIALEHSRLEGVALEQAVELGAVAPGEARGLGHVAAGDFQDSNQITSFEGLPRRVQ